MITEALQYFTSLARTSNDPKLILDQEGIESPRSATYVIGEKIVDVPISKPPRDHHVGSLEDLIALANRFGFPAVVWYCISCVWLVIDDDGHRCERAAFNLELSDTWKLLKELRQRRTEFDHKSFCKLLRIDLAKALPPGALLEIVRSVSFEAGTVVKAKVTRQMESMGRDITSAVSGERDIPETVTLLVPVFKSPRLINDRYSVSCAVDVDPERGTFKLFPVPDEIERVEQLAIENIGVALGEGLNNVNCYQGIP